MVFHVCYCVKLLVYCESFLMGGMLRGWRTFAVSGVQLWSQLMAIAWATGSNTLNCFKQAQKAPLFLWVDVMLQMIAPLGNWERRGLCEVYSINVMWYI